MSDPPPPPSTDERGSSANALACAKCHQPLGRFRAKVLGKVLCGPCEVLVRTAELEKEQRRRLSIAEARSEYDALLAKLAAEGPSAVPPGTILQAGLAAELTRRQVAESAAEAFGRAARVALADDDLSEDEEAALESLRSTLGLGWRQINAKDPTLSHHVLIALANAGRMPVVANPALLLRRGETVHLEAVAKLMKEVVRREFQGGYSGFSFPIGKTGIRYRVGGGRGRSVVVGTQLQVADEGTLCVSSQRAVFLGGKKTIEMPYAKLLNLTVFTDGVQFHLSNRVNAPLLTLNCSDVVAAFVHAAMQHGDF